MRQGCWRRRYWRDYTFIAILTAGVANPQAGYRPVKGGRPALWWSAFLWDDVLDWRAIFDRGRLLPSGVIRWPQFLIGASELTLTPNFILNAGRHMKFSYHYRTGKDHYAPASSAFTLIGLLNRFFLRMRDHPVRM